MDIFTTRVRSTREGNVLTSVCPSIHPSVCPQGGVPISHNALQHFPECHEAVGGARSGTPPGGVPGPPGGVPGPPGGYPAPRGYPDPRGGVPGPPGGVPGPPRGGGTRSGTPPSQDRRSTHYTAGGMPLAFTQEDFLVVNVLTFF